MNYDPPLHLHLIAPAFLLALLKKWTILIAPRYGIYFTAEAATILYAYFALARAVYVYHNSRDSEGCYSRARARKAEQDFHRAYPGVVRQAAGIALPLVTIAIAADILTTGAQWAAQKIMLGAILSIELIVWLIFAPKFVLACAKWTPVQPFDYARARRLAFANRSFVTPSFLLAALILGVGSSAAIKLLYDPLRAFVVAVSPTWIAIFLYSTAFYAFLAAFALWLQCLWSFLILRDLKEPNLASNPRAPTEAEEIAAAMARRHNRNLARLIGLIALLGGLLLVCWLMLVELLSRYEATVVGATTMCEYSWKISKNRYETKHSDCTYAPTPDQAPLAAQLKVWNGLELKVRFTDDNGKEVTGALFVPNPEADRARASGKYSVVYRPASQTPISRPLGYSFLIMIGLLPLMGFLFFFIDPIQGWLRRRGFLSS